MNKWTGVDDRVANETTIGAKLRQARLDKHISLDELQQITKIQKRYLEAIESERFEALPGTYYVRTFIRQYAAAVGEDGDRLVAVYEGKESLEAPLPKRPEPETVSGSRKAMHVAEKTGSFTIRYLPMILLGLVALTIIGIVGYMMWQDRTADSMIQSTSSSVVVENSAQQKESQTTSESVQSSESSVEETTTSTSQPTEEMTIVRESATQSDTVIAITKAKGPITLEFTGLDAPCWVGVTVNGTSTYQHTLQAKEVQTTILPENANNATITLGASMNVTMKANGKDVDFNDPKFEPLQKNVHLNIQYQQ